MEEEVQVLSNAKKDDKSNEKYLFYKLVNKMKSQKNDNNSTTSLSGQKETNIVIGKDSIVTVIPETLSENIENRLNDVECNLEAKYNDTNEYVEILCTKEEKINTDNKNKMIILDTQGHTPALDAVMPKVSLKSSTYEEMFPVEDISSNNLDNKCLNYNEDSIKEDLKSLMKVVVQELKPSLPLDKSGHISKEQCLECNFTSKYKQKMEDHEQSIHNGEVRFTCSQCSHKTFYEHEMIKHMEVMHFGEEVIIHGIGCELCNKSVEHKKCELMNEEEKVKPIFPDLKCKDCQYTCKEQISLKRHVKINHNRMRYACDKCKFEAIYKSDIAIHQKSAHKEEDRRIIGIGCKSCKSGEIHTQCSVVRTRGFVRWDSQMNKHLKCIECSFETGLPLYLKNHIKLVHAGNSDQSKILNCLHCEFQTLNGLSLKNHLRSLHEKKTRFYCSKCDYKSFYSHYIAQHIKSNHKNEGAEVNVLKCQSCKSKDFKCICNKMLKKTLQRPTDYSQFEPKSLKCPSCEFTSNFVSSLNFHKRTQHVNDEWYFCNICDTKSYSKQKVAIHIQLKHNDRVGAIAKQIGCLQCKSSTDHEQCEMNVNPTKPRTNVKNRGTENCKDIDCDYNSVKQKYIAIHQRLNHGDEAIPKEGILKCILCEFETNRKTILERHIKSVHNKEVRFECSFCGKKSFYRQTIILHIDVYHKNNEARLLVIGCTQCIKNNPHLKCDSIREIKENKQALATKDVKDQKWDMSMLNCDECAYTTKKRTRIINHQKNRHGIISKFKDDVFARFQCNQCAFISTHSKSLKKHKEKVHFKQKIYFCSACDYKSDKKIRSIAHTKRAHKEMKVMILLKFLVNDIEEFCETFKCEQCDDTFTKIGTLTKHLKTYHQQIKRYSCSECNFKSYEKYLVESHSENTHQEAKLITLSISNPKLSSANIGKDKDSIANKKTRKQRKITYVKRRVRSVGYKCKLCSFTKYSLKSLIFHMKTDHDNAKLFECNSCPYKCNWLPNLKTHEQAKHSGTKYECEICGWKTAWKPPFFEHKRVVHGLFQKNSKYRADLELSDDLCDLCGFSANSKRSMRLHISSGCEMKNNPTANRYKQYKNNEKQGYSSCTQCMQLALNSKSLAQHQAAVHNINKSYRLCKECGFQATSLFHLNTHKYETHKIGETSCSVCELVCTNRFSLLIHMNGKHPKGGLSCDLCKFTAKSKSLLKQHKDSIHLGNVYLCHMCDYEGLSKASLHMHRMRVHAEQYLTCNECRFKGYNIQNLKAHQLENHSRKRDENRLANDFTQLKNTCSSQNMDGFDSLVFLGL